MILVACEFSGAVRDAFLRRGYDAISCDLLPSESSYGKHVQGDVRELLQDPWDAIIAHPPCTRLCNSGVRWLHERNLWDELDEACEFFKTFLNANSEHIAVENPIMHKYGVERIGRNCNFSVQPWMFGNPVKKATCFWTKNLPPLTPTNVLDKNEAVSEIYLAPDTKDRWKIRSRTFSGIADAIADQWGSFVYGDRVYRPFG